VSIKITVEHVVGVIPTSILALQGDLDASNYQDVVAKAQQLYGLGFRNLLVDLSEVGFMSSSGIVALHSMALIMRGESAHNPESGWNVFHAIEQDQSGRQRHIKLLNPQPKVLLTLQKTGMDAFFDIYSERQAALASFLVN
jgi:anti-anti-sigma factor